VAKMLNIHRNTVNRYWNMSADEYDKTCTIFILKHLILKY
jgi:hypothetical protein